MTLKIEEDVDAYIGLPCSIGNKELANRVFNGKNFYHAEHAKHAMHGNCSDDWGENLGVLSCLIEF